MHTILAALILQVVANTGADAQAVARQVLSGEGSHGYDAASGRYDDMLELGVVDPVEVVRTTLRSAVSIAVLLLTTDCMIADVREGHVNRSDETSNSIMFNAGYTQQKQFGAFRRLLTMAPALFTVKYASESFIIVAVRRFDTPSLP